MKKKQILLFTSSHMIGGIETKLNSLINGLDQNRFDVTLMLIYPFYKARNVDSESRERQKSFLMEQSTDVVELTMKSRYDFMVIFRTVRRIKSISPDILYYFSLGAATFIAPLAGRFAGVPCVIREIATILDGLYPKPLRGLDRWLDRYVNTIVVPSRFLKQLVSGELGFEPGKIAVIPNAIEADKFAGQKRKEDLARELGIGKGKRVVGIIGNLIPVKAHEIMLEAIPAILEQDPQTRFIFIGDGPRRAELERKARDLKIDTTLVFLGYRSDVEAIIPLFDIGVSASYVETHGIALIEMMAAGVPVAATRVGGIPEIIDHMENGLLFEPGDPAALSAAVNLLSRDERLRKKLGRNGAGKAKNVFSINTMISMTEKLFISDGCN